VPYVLDTNAIRAFLDRDIRVVARVSTIDPATIFVTIVSFEEATRGQDATLNRQLNEAQLIRAYADLARTLAYFASVNVLAYDMDAAHHDTELRATVRRMSTKDRRIAAIAVARGCTLVTRNVVDFRDVPGLALEDWMAP